MKKIKRILGRLLYVILALASIVMLYLFQLNTKRKNVS
jgi:uncharacterized membrane protein YuzA (DUF378 family)